jgi:hypothetical protein
MTYMLEVLNLLQEYNPLNYNLDEVMPNESDSFEGELLFTKYTATLSTT